MLWQYWLELGIVLYRGDEIKAECRGSENRKCGDFHVQMQCCKKDYKLNLKTCPIK